MKKLYAGAFLVCTMAVLQAQEVIWQKDIRSNTQDFLSQVTTTIDQQYLITGSSIQSSKLQAEGSKQNNGYDFHLVKLNQQGEQVWEKYFAGNNHDYIQSTISTQDGGFALAGTSFSTSGLDKKDASKGGSDIWLIRLNEFGDELWQKTIGTAQDEEAKAVIQTTDFGFLVAGSVKNSPKGFGSKDVMVIKLDKNGKEISQIILGGKGLDEVEKMIPTPDGGALLGVYSRSSATGNEKIKVKNEESVTSHSKSTENFGEGDYWIVKINRDGKVEWEKNFGGKGDDHLTTLAFTSAGYIIGGSSRSERSGNKTVGIEGGTDVWLISLNSHGEELWQKSYNFGNRDVLMGMNVISGREAGSEIKGVNATKGILLGGYTQAEGRIEANDETFWMLYLDQNGNEQWRKYVKGESRQREERLSDLRLNRDGSIILAGTSAEELGKENWKIVKLGDSQIDQLIDKQDIRIYPNPVSDYCYVEIGIESGSWKLGDGKSEAEIIIYDMGGRQLQSLKTKNKVTRINTQNLIQGAYLVVVKTNDNKTANAKIIKK
ncbi:MULTISPECIES: T9SS type A sorting domain-containing protein [Chryseobacterium]|uniref:Por secretion system C-terminal sorting domain n=1 Tax=Chryseobacterium taihuense TaxID=1141221 RepID=A0A4U8WPD0_9FLAO|nr:MULTISPECIES: T9SS type A sorting domain-containing protein [Chryseobacterium]QQV02482.1 T9SS type A sorting domain-containing protein [Chryseobacterium sp. FDAARGOS 1104]QQV03071.1 T9SS type A sorting domain-containing protein [Chryseobacterium sp. FDAARGOS 1104]VFB03633.1 Por secretion system C-terminal sorting domain [Chryseobacterium taihuense]VFB04269.1 Por secretion system C-terminal sorting domain [Chryseobacterium taihuense]